MTTPPVSRGNPNDPYGRNQPPFSSGDSGTNDSGFGRNGPPTGRDKPTQPGKVPPRRLPWDPNTPPPSMGPGVNPRDTLENQLKTLDRQLQLGRKNIEMLQNKLKK